MPSVDLKALFNMHAFYPHINLQESACVFWVEFGQTAFSAAQLVFLFFVVLSCAIDN